MFFIQLLVYVRTVKPRDRYNEPLCNEVRDITNDFLDPSNGTEIYEKESRYNDT